MSGTTQTPDIDFSVDKNNLYREEAITDLKVASVRRLIPIGLDGKDDRSRTPVFVGHTQLMSPEGPVPIQAKLAANNLQEALDEFPKAMELELANIIEKLKQMQQQQQQAKQQDDSRIIVPGR
jgi:hypothetical protein